MFVIIPQARLDTAEKKKGWLQISVQCANLNDTLC